MDILPLVSVIIPVFNTEKYVETAVLSVLNQSYKNIEIIIVVDGSPDNAYCVCQNLQATHSNIRLVKHEVNKGASATRNTGISISKGEYILFLDSDDTLLPDAIKDMLEIIIEDNEYGAEKIKLVVNSNGVINSDSTTWAYSVIYKENK